MPFNEHVYDAGIQLARPLLQVAAPFSTKLRAGLQGRRGARERLIDWAGAHRDPARPLVWVHAPSVGEALMAQAIVAETRAMMPSVQVVFTHFSPSALRMADRVGADVHDYIPWDTPRDARMLLAALKPNTIAFVRTEIWPALVREAAAANVTTSLVNAVLAPRSSRLKGTARWLLQSSYATLNAVGAVARDHADRFQRLGVPARRIHLTGDARFDQVHARIGALDRAQPLLQRFHDPRVATIVAGSTWPADEIELLKPLANARKGCPMRILIAPHEPDESHLRGLEQRLDANGFKHRRLAEVEQSGDPLPEVVLIDRVGILADLYAIATIAYVGGGFHDAGLHSVVEPAALGVPVIFGPRHGNAREADELAGNGGGFVASDGAAAASLMANLATNKQKREIASANALSFVRGRLGGARRNAELIVNLAER